LAHLASVRAQTLPKAGQWLLRKTAPEMQF
jgi:hypothetical protein